jgi:DNA-binding CsgD family transcriptional regulator
MPPQIRIDRERVKQLLAQGLTQKQIAIRLGVSTPGVATVVKRIRTEAAA